MTDQGSLLMRMVSSMPDKNSALTNCVYVSPDDLWLSVSDNHMVMINHVVWKVRKHQQVMVGSIALNSSQRMCANVSIGDVVEPDVFGSAHVNTLSPINSIIYELVNADGHVVDDAIYNEWDDDGYQVNLMNILTGSVVTEKQIIVFDYEEKNWRMRIKHIKDGSGQEIFRGFVAPKAHIRFDQDFA